MIKKIKLLPLIITLLLPSTLLGETPKHKPDKPVNSCPDNLQSLLMGINNSLLNKKWINFDLDACPQIQAEIVREVDRIIDSDDFDKLLAVMNQRTMRMVRNAFFARRGYKFDDPDLQKHFMSYQWYKSSESNNIMLTPEENRRVDLLKKIEDSWNIKDNSRRTDLKSPLTPSLPAGVEIVDKGGKTLLNFKERTLDISTKTYADHPSWKDFFTIRVNATKTAVLVCTQKTRGESTSLAKMNLYTPAGKHLHGFDDPVSDDRMLGMEDSTELPAENSVILISYSNAGCCGATWDTLATFDSNLKPMAVMNCGESACHGTSLFIDANDGTRYIAVEAQGGFNSSPTLGGKSAKQYVNFNQEWSVKSGNAFINTWSLWSIDNIGHLNLVIQASEKHRRHNCGRNGEDRDCLDPPLRTYGKILLMFLIP